MDLEQDLCHTSYFFPQRSFSSTASPADDQKICSCLIIATHIKEEMRFYEKCQNVAACFAFNPIFTCMFHLNK